MTIKEPFGPWKHGNSPDVIRRDSDRYTFWISLRDNSVIYRNPNDLSGGMVMKQPDSSLAEAVAYVDQYIADNFEIEKTAEQKLSDALAEIALLKQELKIAVRQDAHRAAKAFAVGRCDSEIAW